MANDDVIQRATEVNRGQSPRSIASAIHVAGLLMPRLPGPYDDQHLIEFRDDGWTIQHTLGERTAATLFDCPISHWGGGDPGVRGRFVLNDDGTIGEPVVA